MWGFMWIQRLIDWETTLFFDTRSWTTTPRVWWRLVVGTCDWKWLLTSKIFRTLRLILPLVHFYSWIGYNDQLFLNLEDDELMRLIPRSVLVCVWVSAMFPHYLISIFLTAALLRCIFLSFEIRKVNMYKGASGNKFVKRWLVRNSPVGLLSRFVLSARLGLYPVPLSKQPWSISASIRHLFFYRDILLHPMLWQFNYICRPSHWSSEFQ